MSNGYFNFFPTLTSFEEYEQFKSNREQLEKMAQVVIERYPLTHQTLRLFSEGTNIVFAYGKSQVIKIFPPFHQDQFKSELLVLEHLQNKLSVKTPTLEFSGEIAGWPYLIISQLEGTLLEELWQDMEHANKIIIIQQLAALIREVHALPTDGLESIDCHWQTFIEKQIQQCVEQHRSTNFSIGLLNQIPAYLSSIKQSLLDIEKPVILTGEYTPMNFLVKQEADVWYIDGLIDFGDAMLGLPEYDLLGPAAFLIQGNQELLREFLYSYGFSPKALTQTLSHKMTALMLLHRYSNLDVQIRIPNWKHKIATLEDLENLVWGF